MAKVPRKTLGLLVLDNLTQRLRGENIFGGKIKSDCETALRHLNKIQLDTDDNYLQ